MGSTWARGESNQQSGRCLCNGGDNSQLPNQKTKKQCTAMCQDDNEVMKTSRALGAGLGLLAVMILKQFFYPAVNKSSLFNGVNRDDISNSTISTTIDGQGKQSEKANTQQEESVIFTESQFEQYTFHPKCPCQRRGPSLSNLELQFNSSTIEFATHSSQPWKPTQGSYVGNSTCNRQSISSY